MHTDTSAPTGPANGQEVLKVVGISKLIVSNDFNDVLITYSLGSCIGVSMYDPEARVGGLIHCMLPTSKNSKEKAAEKPAMFVDTGVVAMLNELYALGATAQNLIVKVAGGGSPMDEAGRFRIGDRNFTVLRKVLWKNDLMLRGEDVGGTVPRTVTLAIADGKTTVKTRTGDAEL